MLKYYALLIVMFSFKNFHNFTYISYRKYSWDNIHVSDSLGWIWVEKLWIAELNNILQKSTIQVHDTNMSVKDWHH